MDHLWRDLIGSFFGMKPPPPPPEPQERRKQQRAAAGLKVTLQWISSSGRVRSASGFLENASAEGFGVRTRKRFKEGQTVWLTRPDSPPLKSIVRHVQRGEDDYVLGLARILVERRREDRTPIAGAAVLRRTGPRGEAIEHDVRIRNIASEGVQLECSQAIPANEIARLIGTAVECVGAIRYCVPWNGKFLVGLFLTGKAHLKASLEPSYRD